MSDVMAADIIKLRRNPLLSGIKKNCYLAEIPIHTANSLAGIIQSYCFSKPDFIKKIEVGAANQERSITSQSPFIRADLDLKNIVKAAKAEDLFDSYERKLLDLFEESKKGIRFPIFAYIYRRHSQNLSDGIPEWFYYTNPNATFDPVEGTRFTVDVRDWEVFLDDNDPRFHRVVLEQGAGLLQDYDFQLFRFVLCRWARGARRPNPLRLTVKDVAPFTPYAFLLEQNIVRAKDMRTERQRNLDVQVGKRYIPKLSDNVEYINKHLVEFEERVNALTDYEFFFKFLPDKNAIFRYELTINGDW